MASSKWRGILAAGEAGRMAGEGLGGIGEGIFQAMNKGMTPDQMIQQRLLEDYEKRKEQTQIGREDRNIRNDLLLKQAMGELGGVVTPEMTQMRQTAMEQGGVAMPQTVQIGGMEIDPGLASQFRRQREREILADEIEKEKVKRAALPHNNQFVGFMGNAPMQYNPRTGTLEPVSVGGGVQVTGPLDAKTKTTASSRGLTENAKMAAIGLAGKHGVNIKDPKYMKEDGTIDYMALTFDARQNEGKEEVAKRNEKLNGMTTDQKNKVGAYMAIQNDLVPLKQQIKELSDAGKFPSAIDNAIAVAANQPPDGFFSALLSGAAKALQTTDSKELEGNKAMISTALTNAISGAAVPDNERVYLVPFLPQTTDDVNGLLIKIAGLERHLNNKVNTLSQSGQAGAATQGNARDILSGLGDKVQGITGDQPKKKGFKVLSSE
jgi:hypothetical protein